MSLPCRIINLDNADSEIKFFHENGYLKPNINFKDEIIQLKDLLDPNNKIDHQNKFTYNLNSESIKAIKKILNSNLSLLEIRPE